MAAASDVDAAVAAASAAITVVLKMIALTLTMPFLLVGWVFVTLGLDMEARLVETAIMIVRSHVLGPAVVSMNGDVALVIVGPAIRVGFLL